MPPHTSSISSERGKPSGNSKFPGRFTWPLTQKILVPGLFSVPHCRYHSPPFAMMCGTAQSVSTLFTVVGMPNTPAAAGNGGFTRGSPRRPSSEFINPVSSPQM